MIVVTADIDAKPGKWGDAKTAAAGLRESARQGNAATVYNFFADETTLTLHVIEVYEDETKMRQHIDSTDFGPFAAAVSIRRIMVLGTIGPDLEAFVRTWGPVTTVPEL